MKSSSFKFPYSVVSWEENAAAVFVTCVMSVHLGSTWCLLISVSCLAWPLCWLAASLSFPRQSADAPPSSGGAFVMQKSFFRFDTKQAKRAHPGDILPCGPLLVGSEKTSEWKMDSSGVGGGGGTESLISWSTVKWPKWIDFWSAESQLKTSIPHRKKSHLTLWERWCSSGTNVTLQDGKFHSTSLDTWK